MPFTPFHMGPGILVKAILQGSFSLMVFDWAQIVMDVQPLFVLLTGEGHLHGFSHTYVGATLLAVFSALSGKYLSEIGLRILGPVDVSRQAIEINRQTRIVCFAKTTKRVCHAPVNAQRRALVEATCHHACGKYL